MVHLPVDLQYSILMVLISGYLGKVLTLLMTVKSRNLIRIRARVTRSRCMAYS